MEKISVSRWVELLRQNRWPGWKQNLLLEIVRNECLRYLLHATHCKRDDVLEIMDDETVLRMGQAYGIRAKEIQRTLSN